MAYHLANFRVPQVVRIPQFENPWTTLKECVRGERILVNSKHIRKEFICDTAKFKVFEF